MLLDIAEAAKQQNNAGRDESEEAERRENWVAGEIEDKIERKSDDKVNSGPAEALDCHTQGLSQGRHFFEGIAGALLSSIVDSTMLAGRRPAARKAKRTIRVSLPDAPRYLKCCRPDL